MSFTYLFYQHVMFRKSCNKCHFANTKRPSDMTIADFWGWEKTDSKINVDDKGVSLVLLNTEKGQKLFEAIKERMEIVPVNLEECLQPNMSHPSPENKYRNQLERDYVKRGFKYVYYRYGNVGPVYLMRQLKSYIGKILKR